MRLYATVFTLVTRQRPADNVRRWCPVATHRCSSQCVDLSDRWLLLASSAVHHYRDAHENKEKQNQENCTVQHDNCCTMWGQGGDKKEMVQGLVATEWKRKSCNHFAGIANWLWKRLHKLYADGPDYLLWLTGKGKTFHNQAGHLYEREHFTWSTSRGNVNLPFHRFGFSLFSFSHTETNRQIQDNYVLTWWSDTSSGIWHTRLSIFETDSLMLSPSLRKQRSSKYYNVGV